MLPGTKAAKVKPEATLSFQLDLWENFPLSFGAAMMNSFLFTDILSSIKTTF